LKILCIYSIFIKKIVNEGIKISDFGDNPKNDAISFRLNKVCKLFSKYNSDFDRVLDIGCGSGDTSLYIKNMLHIKDVYGIDINKNDIELARCRGVKAIYLNISEDNFPFEENYFDAIFAGEVIEHLYDPDKFLDEAYRVLKAGGCLIITTPNLAAWYNRIALLFGFQPFWMDASLRHPNVGKLKKVGTENGEHIRVFTSFALADILKLHRFDIIRMEYSLPPIISKGLSPYFYFLERIMSSLKLSSDLIVVSKKL
jgi:SAM-dependent methyltransferase